MDEYPLPQWAQKYSEGNYLEMGAHLETRDGRHCGNAFVDAIERTPGTGAIAVVITDAGNEMMLTWGELWELFYPPRYVVKLDRARLRARLMQENP